MTPDTPEFSRPIAVDRLPHAGTQFELEATPAERAALAERFGLIELRSLTARVTAKPLAGGPIVRVTGRLSAEAVQACVVSLAPVTQTIDEDLALTFGPDAGDEEGDEIELSMDDEDPPDPIIDGKIDLGEAVAEHLALALDPFPRAPGAAFTAPAEEPEPPEQRPSPFAVLAGLRQKKE